MIHLTGQNYNSREIIQNIFSPLIGVIASPLADDICHKNNLSFPEMLQPFCKLPCDAHFRDASGTSVSIKGLRLNICEIDWRPPQTVLARKMLNEAVFVANNDTTKVFSVGSINMEVPTAEPWFEKWRETFLTVQFPSDHEFTRHFLSCLIILSSSDPNIMETANKLTHSVHILQSVTPQKLPKWFYPNDVLNSYVVLHEVFQGDLLKAQQSYEMLKSTFGENKCFLIQLNSLNRSVPNNLHDYWAPYIKRQSKELQDPNSVPRTPQDSISVISMPTQQYSPEESHNTTENDLTMLHPLSPMQETAIEAINSRFSVSTESIASQIINTNIWSADIDIDSPHGSYLNAADVENLRHFVQDYAVRALTPYVEHLVFVLNESITNKKGVSKSLLSATKRWFVTNKPGVGASQNAIIYTNDSVELQTRKLGDLYFMFGHYNLAFQAYHQAKRDFNADAAWQYYAGALEMAAISAFMLGTANRKTYDYMEDAIVCYLTVCKLQQFATRATLLSIECLKTSRLYGEAAKQLIRMTSEESDLRSALLLEQAAYCFLATQPSMHRKYAFHAVLAGNRYSRAGQRKHSLRCYTQAYEVFKSCGWSHAEDQIQYSMAKQAYTLKKLEEASESFAHLLRTSSMQSAAQHSNFLKEYIQTQKELFQSRDVLGLFPLALPQVMLSSLRVMFTVNPSLTVPVYEPASNININSDLTDENIWHKIEEMILTTAAKRSIIFKPSCNLYTYDYFRFNLPLAVLGESIEISVRILNTIKCSINLSEIELLWKLKLESNEVVSNISTYEGGKEAESDKTSISAVVEATSTRSVVLEEHEKKQLFFQLTPKMTGELNIVGIVGKIAANFDSNASLLGCLSFKENKKSPNEIKSKLSLCDSEVSIKIVAPVPFLTVSFSIIPTDLVVGEVVPVKVLLRNTGTSVIDDVYVGCDCPRWITFLDKEAEPPLEILKYIKDLTNEKLLKDKEIRRQRVFHLLKNKDDVALKPQESTIIPMWIQAPYKKGEIIMRLLFYYGFKNDTEPNLKFRLVRHSWKFKIHECLRVDATSAISNVKNHDLGLNVQFKNQNEMHHPLMVEVYVNSLGTFSSQYKVDNKKTFLMNTTEITAGNLGEHCLHSGKSAAFQFSLLHFEPEESLSLEEYIQYRLSFIDLYPAKYSESPLPKLNEIYSFLVKNETTFINENATTEEFNTLVGTDDQHITISIKWVAVIFVNSEQRIAHGLHFVKLRNLYESVSCPKSSLNIKNPLIHPIRICEFRHRKEECGQYFSRRDDIFNNDDDCNWELNNEFVGTRCMFEDEQFSVAIKF